MGMIFAVIVWLFLKLMKIGTAFLWDYLPGQFDLKVYPIIIYLVGGLILGLIKSYPLDYACIKGYGLMNWN